MDSNPSSDQVPVDKMPSSEPQALNIPLRQSQIHLAAPAPRAVSDNSVIRARQSLNLNPISPSPIIPEPVMPLNDQPAYVKPEVPPAIAQVQVVPTNTLPIIADKKPRKLPKWPFIVLAALLIGLTILFFILCK